MFIINVRSMTFWKKLWTSLDSVSNFITPSTLPTPNTLLFLCYFGLYHSGITNFIIIMNLLLPSTMVSYLWARFNASFLICKNKSLLFLAIRPMSNGRNCRKVSIFHGIWTYFIQLMANFVHHLEIKLFGIVSTYSFFKIAKMWP